MSKRPTDEEICMFFGTTLEEVDADAEKYENGDTDDFVFGTPIEGRPGIAMKASSVKFFDFELLAIDRAAKKLGITRSEFIRRSCDNEIASLV